MRLELEKLKEEAKSARKSGILLDIDYRRRMYELEEELRQAADELVNKHLLLRPNARFAVIWKLIFVCFAILDISHQAVQPIIGRYQDQIIATTTAVWPECAVKVADSQPVTARPRFSRAWWRKNGRKKHQSWYCREPYIMAHSVFINVLRFMLTKSLLMTIGIVCYVDVGMTFFIGELHPDTGVLSPKPFFARWIFPGLLLELLANPQMESTSKYVLRFVDEVLYVGPTRVWRWTVVFFYPLSKIIVKALAVHVWHPVVEHENNELIRVVELMAPPPRQSMLTQRIPSALKVAEGRSCYYTRND